MKCTKQAKRPGFSLVEVALAMMVLAVGLMAVFMIFPTGLQFGRESTERSYGALFAEDVSSGMRARATTLSGVEYWQIGNNGQYKLPATAFHVWDSPGEVVVKSGQVNHLKYTPKGVSDRALTEVEYGYTLGRHTPKSNVGWHMDIELRVYSPPAVALTGKSVADLSEQTRYYWTTIMMPDVERYR